MALYSKDLEDRFLQMVQRLLVANPNMPATEMVRQLERNQVKLDWRYVSKLIAKVRSRNRYAVKAVVRETVIGQFLALNRELQTTTWTLIMDQSISPATRLGAIRTAMQLGEKLLNMLFDTKVLERDLGTLTVKNESGKVTPLPAGYAEGWLRVVKGWNLLNEQEKVMLEGKEPTQPAWWFENQGFPE